MKKKDVFIPEIGRAIKLPENRSLGNRSLGHRDDRRPGDRRCGMWCCRTRKLLSQDGAVHRGGDGIQGKRRELISVRMISRGFVYMKYLRSFGYARIS